jgi:adenylyltransferase/sulfurtransferase
MYLAAAGVGTLGFIDDDVVSLTNLHRQILYGMDDIGGLKAERAAARLQQMNPDVDIEPYQLRLTNKNALDLLSRYDIIVDASDNFPTRYLVNDASVLLKKPLVYGAVSKFEGQVAVLNHPVAPGERSPNYRDLFPVPPVEGEVANCAEAGVLGVLPGIIGNIQAAEVMKLITGIGRPLINQLQTFHLLTNQWYTFEIGLNPAAQGMSPKDKAVFINSNYEWSCSTEGLTEISAPAFDQLLLEKNVMVLDVREGGELPLVDEFDHQHIPLSELKEKFKSLEGDTIVAFCQTGKRSRLAARLLADSFPSKKIYSLQNGIVGWKQHAQEE